LWQAIVQTKEEIVDEISNKEILSPCRFSFCFVICRFCNKLSESGRKKLVSSQQQQSVKIGLIPEQNIFTQKKRYEPLAAYIFKKTGIKIELKILSRYGNIIDQVNTLGLDGAFFGSFTAAIAHKKLGVKPCARPEWTDGSSISVVN